ncbi:hypothetical protein [Coprococcus comes]|uniref:hypothetical protein n=1 Tax=Coprococcus comes TaxID=410072 RepID=UPI001570A50F|nr:hypothetical protein [Coprococcus comes]NSD32083.1 hypothetical protein [Coprococcus comes]
MYLFEAHYTNMDNDEQITRPIKLLDDRDEKSLYLMAMGVAYDLKEKNECLGTVEFIAC